MYNCQPIFCAVWPYLLNLVAILFLVVDMLSITKVVLPVFAPKLHILITKIKMYMKLPLSLPLNYLLNIFFYLISLDLENYNNFFLNKKVLTIQINKYCNLQINVRVTNL